MKAITVLVMTMAPVTLVGASATAGEGGSVAHEEATHHVDVPEDVRMVAPPGSCVLNPDADRCPPVDAIVASEVALADGSTAFAPLDLERARTARASRRAHRNATAAQAVGHACAVQSWDPVKLFHPGGDAFIRASGANECRSGVGVSYQDLRDRRF